MLNDIIYKMNENEFEWKCMRMAIPYLLSARLHETESSAFVEWPWSVFGFGREVLPCSLRGDSPELSPATSQLNTEVNI